VELALLRRGARKLVPELAFFRGSSLDPVPPGKSKHKEVRYLDVREGELDEKQFVAWVKQASKLPGEKM
jgi:hypothetical protein